MTRIPILQLQCAVILLLSLVLQTALVASTDTIPPPPPGHQRVYFVRHAEAMHNYYFKTGARSRGVRIRDPELSPEGHKQAEALRGAVETHLARGEDIQVVLTSPLTRAIQTALAGFGHTDIPIQVSHLHTEHDHGSAPCDTGSPQRTLRRQFSGERQLDFSSLPADPWWPQGETRQQLKARVTAFKQALQRHPARVIVVIGHGGFLRTLLELDEGGADVTIDHCQLHNHVLEWPHEAQHDEL